MNVFVTMSVIPWYAHPDSHKPCVPRGTQGKQKPQGPGRGRSGSREEDQLEQKTLEETLRLAKLRGLSKTPFTHPCGLFPSTSHPCGMIVHTANLVDS